MTQLTLVRRGDFYVPAEASDVDVMRKHPMGVPLVADVRQPRNYPFLKKAMALIKLAFSYWEPTSYLSSAESHTVRRLADYLCRRGIDAQAVSALCSDFMNHVSHQREETLDADKSFDEFRAWVTIQAGYYDEVMTPGGPKRIPKSWSFARMSEEEFGRMYAQLLNVCWKLVLSQTFESPEQAEAAANQLGGFD